MCEDTWALDIQTMLGVQGGGVGVLDVHFNQMTGFLVLASGQCLTFTDKPAGQTYHDKDCNWVLVTPVLQDI
jgi:hypothetical protein